MSATDEALNQRDAALRELRAQVARLQRAVSDRNQRRMEASIDSVRTAREVAQARQTTYLTRARRGVEDSDDVIMKYLYEDSLEHLEAADEVLRELIAARAVNDSIAVFAAGCRVLTSGLVSMLDALRERPIEGIEVFRKELAEAKASLQAALAGADAARVRADDDAAAQRLETMVDEWVPALQTLLRRVEVAFATAEASVTNPSGASGVAAASPTRGTLSPRDRSNTHVAGVPVPGSQSSSLDAGFASGDVRARSASDAGLSEDSLAIKRMDFPKFNGEARTYNSFKRDFLQVIAHYRVQPDWRVAHRLRHECLQGKPKIMCVNLADSAAIWRRLDEEYSDPMRAVDELNAVLARTPQLQEDDYERFVALVDYIENADVDLRAAGQELALQNPFTCHTILGRCPMWVRRPVVAEMGGRSLGGADFSWLLSVLVRRRAEARRLMALDPVARGVRQMQRGPARQRQGVGVAAACGGAPLGSDEDFLDYMGAGAGDIGTVAAAPSRGIAPDYQGIPDTSWDAVPRRPAGAAGVAGAVPARRCVLSACTEPARHFLAKCPGWAALELADRVDLVKIKRLCRFCLEGGHMAGSCPRKSHWRPCSEEGCGQWHHRSLHGASWVGAAQRAGDPATAISLAGGPSCGILLAQDIPVGAGTTGRVLWDSGSSVSLVSNQFARAAGLDGTGAIVRLTVVGGGEQALITKLFRVPLLDAGGRSRVIFAYGIDNVAGDVGGLELDAANSIINPEAVSYRPVDVLVGVSEADIHPRLLRRRGTWIVFQSDFGSGFLAAGGSERARSALTPARVGTSCHVRVHCCPVPDFITAEAMGTEVPRLCATCSGCRQCQFRAVHITWQEAEELRQIEAGLHLDVGARKWTSTYPCIVDPGLLADNRAQAISLMGGLERRLRKMGRLADFNSVFRESVERGVFEPLLDLKYKGPTNYISLVVAFKPGVHATTPLRICLNSSLNFKGRSLNSILVKGPAALSELYGVALKFRRWPVAVIRDLKKFYQSVAASTRDQHLRRVVWRYGGDGNPITYISKTVNFGDRPAGAVAQTALRQTAQIHHDVHPVAAETIQEATYVDDTIGGGEDLPAAQDVSNGMQAVAGHGGFTYGEPTFSGQSVDGGHRHVLGVKWVTKVDKIAVEIKVNFHAKIRGIRAGPDLDLEALARGSLDGVPTILTKRLIWRVALGQFDPFGLLCPFLLRLKLTMRSLSAGPTGDGEAQHQTGPVRGSVGATSGWDSKIHDEARRDFLELLKQLAAAAAVMFPRCVTPSGGGECAWLVTFVDGASTASCALSYICWISRTGNQSRLVSGKTRVAPLRRISIPRLELQGAVMGVRLASKIQEEIGVPFTRRLFLTDSSAVLGILRGNLTTYKEFVGTRAAEIRSKTDVSSEWRWLPTAENVADLGTRPGVRPEQLGPGTVYQDGPAWMGSPFEAWPLREKFGAVPAEEVVGAGAAAVLAVVPLAPAFPRLEPGRFSSLRRLITVASLVLRAAAVFRGVPPPDATPVGQQAFGHVTEALVRAAEYRDQAWWWLVAMSRPSEAWDVRQLAGLRASVEVVTGPAHRLVFVRGRRGEAVSGSGDPRGLPLLDGATVLGRLAMRSAHEVRHAGVARTVLQSRTMAWITGAPTAARRAVAGCSRCRIDRACPDNQIMAPLPPERTEPAAAFRHVALDLFGPLLLVDSVRRRVRGEAYGLMIVCLATTAAHIEMCAALTTDAVALALRRFLAIRGTPATILSDPGSQLVSLGRRVSLWDAGAVAELTAGGGIRWRFVPAASQHANGLAERLIGIAKRALSLLGGGHVPARTKEEWDTVGAEVMAIMNARPVAVVGNALESLHPITPNDLLLGRSTAGVPPVQPELNDVQLTRRLAAVQELAALFWTRWITFVLPAMQSCSKWNQPGRGPEVGDVVLLLYESRISTTYRLGIVKSLLPPGEDGVIRSVIVEYMRPDGQRGEVSRSIHSIATIIRLEEQRAER